MRIVWKDTAPRSFKPVKYRGYIIQGSPNGWTISVEGDDNLYKTHYCAKNAIDKHLGGTAQKRGCAKRQAYGITIIGKVDKNEDETA